MVQKNDKTVAKKTAAKEKKKKTAPEAPVTAAEHAAPEETAKKKTPRAPKKKAPEAAGKEAVAAPEKAKVPRKPRVKAKKEEPVVTVAPAPAAPAEKPAAEKPVPAPHAAPKAPVAPKPAAVPPAPAAAPKAPAAPAHPPKAPAAPAKIPHAAPKPPAAAPAPKAPAPAAAPKAAPAPVPAPKAPEAKPAPAAPAAPVAPKAPEAKPAAAPVTKIKGTIKINELTTVKDLSEKMNVKPADVIKKLLGLGSLVTINQRIDSDTAELLGHEFGYEVKYESLYAEEAVEEIKEDPAKLKLRSPVVTIMGHVDHGKTSLLDAIRQSNVAAGEAGGITQHIGAYKVKTSKGEIAFLDTPGHEAFTAMRSRGAKATDIVVLVVSAADGVMPQTVEAIDHARAANVPIIVAVNKVDLPTANPQQVKQELSKYNLMPEEWGGDTIMVDVSAKKNLNIDQLLEMILLRAEIMELKANPDRLARGVVIEAKLDSRRGPVATVLVQTGTLKIGDNVVVGTTFGKVRAMLDEHGHRLSEAGPGTPTEVLGINTPPQAGDQFVVFEQEFQAREIAQSRLNTAREESLRPRHHLSLEDISAGKVKELRIILKADVSGSIGALADSLERLSTSEINLRIIHSGAGSITESDVMLAAASDALIIGFNLRPDAAVERLADREGVSIRGYRIIYEVINDVKAAMEGLLEPQVKETVLGKAVVKQAFRISKVGTVAGSAVTEGKVQRGAKVRLIRDNVIVYDGTISSLFRFKEDVREVEKGYECGIGLANYADIKSGDVLEVYSQEKVARKL